MTERVLAAQNISRMCLVCGMENPVGLHARFLELEGGDLAGVFAACEHHQGYPGRLHGGLAATILDETIGRAVSVGDPDAWGVTVELTVKYRKPVPLSGDIVARGRITTDGGRIFEGTGEITLPDGTVAVEARGRYLRMSVEKIAEGDFSTQWFADDRPLPETLG